MTRSITIPSGQRLPDGSIHGGWWHDAETGDRIICDLCPRACSLKPGDRGFCFVRENVGGEMLLSTYGHSTGFCVDPIEKKPLNHFLPGTAVLSFGTAGCNLGCKFCQNWDISKSREVARASEAASPEMIAEAAKQTGCHSVAFTYNDPVIWAEYAVDTARACRAVGIRAVAVTAGYIKPAARSYFFQEMDAANIDLKAFTEPFYRQLTYSHLQPVLDTLEWLKKETNVWFELTNLMIPGENDSPDETREMCDWILDRLGDEVPVHFTAFHPDFRLRDHPATPQETLLRAYDVAQQQGIKYVYVGNVHDPQHDSTFCPGCSALLIERNWYELRAYHLDGNRCPHCGQMIAGHFLQGPGSWGPRRQSVRISDYATSASDLEPATMKTESDRSGERSSASNDASEKEIRSRVGSERQASDWTDAQQRQVFRLACEVVVGGVLGRYAQPDDPTLAGAAEHPVMGAFVTLKRQQHLRACCGTLGQSLPLIDAVRGAAERAATDDRRLAPISPSELPFLDLDVSLLSNFQDVQADGSGRIAAVELGRHGLTIHRGESNGLLLPNVAVENDWDRETFLRQLCHKAGLPSYAWKEPETRLQTFESQIIEGTIPADLLADLPESPDSLLTADEVTALRRHCQTNVLALVQGATPNYYMPSCRDLSVQGVYLAVSLPPLSRSRGFARLSMRPGLPLQSTLFQLCEHAARWLGSISPAPGFETELTVQLAALYDSSAHGTLADPDLRGIDPASRAVVVAQHGRYAWQFAPELTAEQVVAAAAERAMIFDSQMAGVFSFAVDTDSAAFEVDNRPQPHGGPPERPSAVAGIFYPDNKDELDEQLRGMIKTAPEQAAEPYPAILVPHAGLRFSGHIAAAVYQRTLIPDQVVIFAPKHSRKGMPWAVAPHASWLLPQQRVASAPQLAERLARSISRLELDAAAHQDEHAIEVQLPLLARLAPHANVIGVAIGEGDLAACCEFADQLADTLRQEADMPLLVISTDLNHYAEDRENRRLDRIALEAIQTLDPAHLYRTVRQHDISMCGLLPAVVVMQTLHNLGKLSQCIEVAYGTSADTGGSVDRVVGYAGLLFC
jgi:AmmeMemoRadiSam system radical SAM enzyme/AmmeMemoRadiSam system protein B/AmmeMemoRadiSam system protein A